MKIPEMQCVDSTSVEKTGYDETGQKLYVRFLESGVLYMYSGVPKAVFTEFLQASSKGGYLNTHIKGAYSYSRL